MTPETQALVERQIELLGQCEAFIAERFDADDGDAVALGNSIHAIRKTLESVPAALASLSRDLETARQQNAALAEPALMGNCYKAERDACRAERALLQADLAAARQERDAALAERNAARARAVDFEARLAAASVHEARAIAAVRAARAETTKAPRLHCASCGATEFSKLYTGGGDVWLHPADAEDSAACGPVYFAALEGQ